MRAQQRFRYVPLLAPVPGASVRTQQPLPHLLTPVVGAIGQRDASPLPAPVPGASMRAQQRLPYLLEGDTP
jgi:hypothetical protein